MSDRSIQVTYVGKNRAGLRCGPWVLPKDIPVYVPFSFVEKYSGAEGVKIDFSSFKDTLTSYSDDGRPMIDFWGPMSVMDGYGRHALDIWRGLKSIGVNARLRSNGYFIDRTCLPEDTQQEVLNNSRVTPARVSVAMSVPYDPMLSDSSSVTKIAITQFETDRIPDKHIEFVNRCDHFITTGSYQVPIWKKGGINVPIDHLVPGVDTDYFTYQRPEPDGKFRVLMVGALTARKDPKAAIRAFQEASGGSRDWEFTIKTRRAKGYDEVQKIAKSDPRIRFLVEDSHPNYILHLYHTHDAFLWPSKGEGVGLPPLEAMACGMEVVCAYNSGMTDYCDSRVMWPVRCPSMEPAGPPDGFSAEYISTYGDVGNWWVPDPQDTANQLGKAYDAWRVGKGKGEKAAQFVRDNFTVEHQARSVWRVVERYL